MPPGPKRKRGRPSNASTQPATADTTASEERPVDYEAEIDEDARPRKRGRPKKSLDDETRDAAVGGKRKRGRLSVEQAAEDETRDQEEAPPPTKRKRGRPSLEKQRDEGVDETETQAPARRRGRKAKADEPQATNNQETEEPQPRGRGRKAAQMKEQAPPAEGDAPQPSQRRKRGRPSMTTEEPTEKTAGNQRRRGRPSLQDLLPGDAQNKSAEDSRAKETKRGTTTAAGEAEARQVAPVKKRGRPSAGRPSNADVSQVEPETNSQPSRRRRSSQNHQPEEPPPSPEKPMLHLVPHSQRVRPSTISSKWSPLSGSSLPAIATLLHAAQQPILQRMSRTRTRREHTAVALRLVAHRISRKLAKGLPFPPACIAAPSRTSSRNPDADAGRETELDFEAVLDARAALERRLGPGVQAVELLRRERRRLEGELAGDYEALRDLEARARGQARERKELLKKAHALTPANMTLHADKDDVTIKPEEELSSWSLFKNLDESLNPLALQLSGHVESIRSNLSQAEGIVPQIAHTRAALQDVLFRNLERGVYEQVVLGSSRRSLV